MQMHVCMYHYEIVRCGKKEDARLFGAEGVTSSPIGGIGHGQMGFSHSTAPPQAAGGPSSLLPIRGKQNTIMQEKVSRRERPGC